MINYPLFTMHLVTAKKAADFPWPLAARLGLLIFAQLVAATAVIFIKASSEFPILLAAYRTLGAAVILTPFFLRDIKSSGDSYKLKQIGWTIVPALTLSVHFISWVIGARLTTVANASLVINFTPIILPFFLWAINREIVTRLEVIGTFVALAGIVILVGTNIRTNPETLPGDLICLGSAFACGAYLAFGRKNQARLSLWLYVVPLYYITGIVCLLCALPFVNPVKDYALDNLLYIAGLILLPTVGTHTIVNYSLKYFRGQAIGAISMMQPVFALILGFIFFREIPPPAFYLSAVLVIAGVLVVVNRNKTA